MRIYTIGHSTRPIAEFIAILQRHEIGQLVDIRTAPGSRRNPQYGGAALAATLDEVGIAYEHIKELGGLRKPRPDSPNSGWRNLSFRGYADHMQTPQFAAGLKRLLALAAARPTVCMCAEAVPWRCHRSLLGDALVARGVEVVDLISETSARPHKLNPMAVVARGQVSYPPEQLELAPTGTR